MGIIGRLRAAHRELAEDQSILIAARMQAQRRGDAKAAAGYRSRLDRIARQMRAAEQLINDETGEREFP